VSFCLFNACSEKFTVAPTTEGRLRGSNICAKPTQLLADRIFDRMLDLTIARYEHEAERRKRCTATVLAALLPLDRLAPAITIDLADEIRCRKSAGCRIAASR
jgi:hypothetical protein